MMTGNNFNCYDIYAHLQVINKQEEKRMKNEDEDEEAEAEIE